MKKYEQSDSTFSTLLRQYPRFEEGFAARGRLNLAKGDTVAALADLDQSLRLSKSLINPYLLKAEIAWKRKDWNEAGENMDAAIRLRPEVADLYVNRAFIKYNSDDFFGAMSDYNYALQLEPDNTSALFNRALLRYEVKDLSRAEEDLSSVLKLDPNNFHALYNRGLIRMEQKKSKDASEDFRAIARKYPKFYPVYYALAETKRQQGDLRGAVQYAREADELVKGYVRNPEKNPLDRPAIAAAESKDAHNGGNDSSEESEMEVMEKFNRLITVSDAVENQLSYNEKIKGRVQDRNVQVSPEPLFALTFNSGPLTLRSVSNYFRELDALNQQHYINRQIYLNPASQSGYDSEETSRLFEYADNLEKTVAAGKARPVDLLALGIARTVLKNYPAAIENLDAAIAADPSFTVAYMARAFARYANSTSRSAEPESSLKD
ncbi:MAG: tetratricopeptide repeat protein, partial [Muribaculaceae bacterium]|nr:tetratricopeptide repeat protein [Muribaculaceae bacterium]